MYFVLYKDRARQWRWTLYAANHRKIADSAESYYNRGDAVAGINLVKGTASITIIEREE